VAYRYFILHYNSSKAFKDPVKDHKNIRIRSIFDIKSRVILTVFFISRCFSTAILRRCRMQMRVQCYAVASKPRCIATVMGLTFSSRAFNLEVGIRVERWHDSLYIHPETETRVSPATHQIIVAIISGMRDLRSTKRSPMSFGSAFFASFLAPVEKLSHDFSSLTGRHCCARTVIIGGSALFLGI